MWNKDKFIEFLAHRRLVPENRRKFYGIWVERFLAFRGNDISTAISGQEIEAFTRTLATTHEDWQVRQAGDAVRLYLFCLQGQGDVQSRCDSDTSTVVNLEQKMREVIRLRHLAMATEKTYIGWLRHFLGWGGITSANDIDSARVIAFLTHLAVKKNVSKATQSQAFNALLFFFRNVLLRDLDVSSMAVRAKKGQRLPVVLSPQEVFRLMEQLEGVYSLMSRLIYGCGLRLNECITCATALPLICWKTDTIFVPSRNYWDTLTLRLQ